MHVQMKDRLAAIRVRIDHDAVTILGKTLSSSEIRRFEQKLPEQAVV